MKRIGILTFLDYDNYGNRLQNYALQKVLVDNNFEAITIKNYYVENDSKLKSHIRSNVIFDYYKSLKSLADYKKAKRYKKFKSFTNNNIKESNFRIAKYNWSKNKISEFDAFVVGSDQVWNYELKRFSNFYFVPFRFSDQKVISYAASFGVSNIPLELEETYKNGLKHFDNISVREDAGAKIVKNLINREVPVVLDPTMLLTKNDWSLVANTSEVDTDFDYLVTYFLGDLSNEQSQYIRKYAKINNLRIINFNDPSHKDSFNYGPEDFIKLFKDSKAVFTDSFHAAVFSILFEKYFKVFDRKSNHKSMTSRIDTLLSLFNIEEQKYSSGNLEHTDIDYRKVKVILKKEVVTSKEYLFSSLS